ncbi:CDP-6-deoxy-delta-3,4-glucoseen reductase [Thiohalorhabdus denitrificans]|uniref:CDP-4-dehydro-6-deoxyglucose reductase n=1 Tax=Thiohalorhabdus denitrificans TaxID=381306 RepID=A0A0P9GGG1_9GAMM|nr:CDP-6-deoxy-delta-3,4-glucoseen reductase [Thiohalorhabdus denitrificans]KPV39107.1 CDP-6-deoxy-delta-3,4-glucoseen reductase [Thiohalorhabdus denitrificans]SCX77506.1 CDP-4-dehydro-6-deoxyglucose reductase [Thiohalorhabdus denitrificans]
MAYTVKLEPSGKQFEVAPGQTILDAAMHHGINLPYGCRNGACGDCKGKLVAGQVDYGQYQPTAMSEEERAQGAALFCQAQPQSDLVIEAYEIDDAKKTEVRRLPCRVHDARKLTHDIMEVRLKLPSAERLQFLAGQYIEVILKDGRRRAFSIANSPLHDDFLTLHIRYVPSGEFTEHVFTGLKPKEIWNFEGPLGNFYLRDSDRPAILVAGGTGLGPIKAMLETAFEEGLERDFHLFFGVRARRDLYLTETLDQWQAEHPNFRWTPALSDPGEEDADWSGETGYIHEVIPRYYDDLSGHEGYLAGPPPMVEAASEALQQLGLDKDRLFSDAFTYSVE